MQDAQVTKSLLGEFSEGSEETALWETHLDFLN